jgi:hypothetical protein
MRIDITAKQHARFTADREISFNDLLSEEERLILSRFTTGRNLWMKEAAIKKILSKRSIVEIIHELTKASQIRLLFDERIGKGEVDLSKVCVQGILFYILICIETGAITFVDKEKISTITTPTFLAIYGKGDSVYIFNELDPHTHELKKLGYVFGDRLKPNDFPFVYH